MFDEHPRFTKQREEIFRSSLENGGDGVEKYKIPESQSMQDFAIQYLMKQKCEGNDLNDKYLIDRVVIGCPRAEHVVEAIKATNEV